MAYTFDKANAERAVAAQDAVFRDDGRAGALPRRLDAERRAHAPAVGAARHGDPGSRPALTSSSCTTSSKDWTQYTTSPRQNPGQGAGDARPDVRRVRQIPGAAARRLGRDPDGRRRARSCRPAGRCSPTPASRSPAFRAATAPSLLNTSYTITAEVDVPQGGAEGMIVTDGGRFGGYGLYLLKGKPVFLWNLLDLKRVRWEGPGGAVARQAHARVRLQI